MFNLKVAQITVIGGENGWEDVSDCDEITESRLNRFQITIEFS